MRFLGLRAFFNHGDTRRDTEKGIEQTFRVSPCVSVVHLFFQKAVVTAANLLWVLSAVPDALAWRRATRQVETAQSAVLTRILSRNANTHYLRHNEIGPGQSRKAYHKGTKARRNTKYLPFLRSFVPLSLRGKSSRPNLPISHLPIATYDHLAPLITRMADGEPNLLTADPVLLFEPTSGSSAATKLIPYTADLKRDFQRGIAPWIVHTFAADPRLLTGRAYWSVSPILAEDRRTAAGIPIGFEEDSSYLGSLAGRLVDAVMAVPAGVKRIPHMTSFRYATLRFLLACPDLTLISVWNPTFLTLLVDPLPRWADRLVADIAEGRLRPPGPIPPHVQLQLERSLRPDPRRADAIRRILAESDEPAVRHRRLWPRLRLISCWADANAAPYANQLARLFPHVRLQPKGLLSTEAFVSFPLPDIDGEGSVLALTSHYFEFLKVGSERAWLAHEVEIDEEYEVVVTTSGGLYRYRTGDRVQVTGWVNGCPKVRFLGRIDTVVDWFGEKLHEEHVGRVVNAVLAEAGIAPVFVMLACDVDRSPPTYVLYLQTAAEDDLPGNSELPGRLADSIETGLQENFHYAYARQLGQLGPVQVYSIATGGLERYIAACVAHGQRAGDVKPTILHRRSGWGVWFTDSVLGSTP